VAAVYTKQGLLERLKKHINSGFPSNDFNVTDTELLMYVDEAIPFVLKGQMFENSKVSGVLELPDAYLVTYAVTLSQNTTTKEWYGTLPQTPLALPNGYQINDAYFITGGGRGQAVFFLSAKRTSYRDLLPKPSGIFARVEGNTIYMKGNEGQFLGSMDFRIQMPISRTSSLSDTMSLPDDAISPIFDAVIKKIAQRFGLPHDSVKDDEPVNATK
jgi:hypothetical protein